MSSVSLAPYPDPSGRTLAVTAVLSFLLSMTGLGLAQFTAPRTEIIPPPSIQQMVSKLSLHFTPRCLADLQRWVDADPQVLFVRVDQPGQPPWEYPRPFTPPAWALLPLSWTAYVSQPGRGLSIEILDLSEGEGVVPLASLVRRGRITALHSAYPVSLFTHSSPFLPTLRRLQARLIHAGRPAGDLTVVYEPLVRLHNVGREGIYQASRRTFVLFGMLYWVLVPLWVFLDARARGSQGAEWGFLCLLTNLAGLIAYLTFRSHTRPTCDRCGRPLEHGYLLCPYCGPREPEECPVCHATVERAWKWCPHCAGPLLRSSQ